MPSLALAEEIWTNSEIQYTDRLWEEEVATNHQKFGLTQIINSSRLIDTRVSPSRVGILN